MMKKFCSLTFLALSLIMAGCGTEDNDPNQGNDTTNMGNNTTNQSKNQEDPFPDLVLLKSDTAFIVNAPDIHNFKFLALANESYQLRKAGGVGYPTLTIITEDGSTYLENKSLFGGSIGFSFAKDTYIKMIIDCSDAATSSTSTRLIIDNL